MQNRGETEDGVVYAEDATEVYYQDSVVMWLRDGEDPNADVTVTDASSFLRGPSVLVAQGELAQEWWQAQQTLNEVHEQ